MVDDNQIKTNENFYFEELTAASASGGSP